MGIGQTIFNVSNVVVGIGVLSVPYAMKQSGYCCLVLIVVVIHVTSTTAKWIGDALQEVAVRQDVKKVAVGARDFGFLAELMVGKRGSAVINAVTVLELWFALVAFMVMNGTNAALLWPEVPTAIAGSVMGTVATACCLIPKDIFAYLSLVSTFAMLAGAVAMVCASYKLSRWAEPYDTKGWQAIIRPENLPRSVGIIVFCFAGHPCFPAIRTRMKSPESWHFCVYVSFFFAALYYSSFGFLGFIVFGYTLSPSVTTNFSEISNALLLREIAAYCFLVKVQLTVPLMMEAVMSAVWPPELGKPFWPLQRVVLLLAIGALTSAAAVLLADALAAIASLAGSLFVMITSVFFPTALRLLLAQPPSGRCRVLQYANIVFVIAFGVLTGISGTLLALSDLWSGKRPH